MITIPYLPKPSLLEYLRTQCHADVDGQRGRFVQALDTSVSRIDPGATVNMVVISGLEILHGRLEVFYRVHYSIWNGGQGQSSPMALGPYIANTVLGSRGAKGWDFAPVASEHNPHMRNRTNPGVAAQSGQQRWAF